MTEEPLETLAEAPVLAEFRHDNLPGDPARWPVFGIVRAMPMSGVYTVRTADGFVSRHEDGYLLVDAGGHPYWQGSV